MDQEEKFNWDKLLKHLEGDKEAGLEAEELNQEELEMLLLAEETNMRLKGIDAEKRFPVEAGWEELRTRYERRKQEAVVVSWSKRYLLTAAAAVFVALLGVAWWFQVRETDPVKTGQSVATQIQLTLPNGEKVAVAESQAPVLKSEGATLKGSTLVYQKETELASVADEHINMNTLEVPYGKQTRLELSDGTIVWVNAGSKLSYPTRFAASKRELTLEGEAFFEVSHDANRPFTVRVKGLDIKVLGTAFNVNTFGTAVKTALVRGKVGLNAGGKSLVLLPGELGSYQQGRELSKDVSDLKVYTAWKDEEIYFDNRTLEEIAFRLKREYNMSFNFENAELAKLHFTIDMPKGASIQTVLNNIRLSTNAVDFVVKGNIVQVKSR
jgi:transmembrane sensor